MGRLEQSFLLKTKGENNESTMHNEGSQLVRDHSNTQMVRKITLDNTDEIVKLLEKIEVAKSNGVTSSYTEMK